MPPKLVSDDARNVVIRPLLYCAEADIARFAALEGYPILPCDLCGSQEHLMRQEVKRLLTTLEAIAPRVRESMLAALGNVRPTHLLDRGLWKQLGLHPTDDARAPASERQTPTRTPTLLRADGRSLPVVGEG